MYEKKNKKNNRCIKNLMLCLCVKCIYLLGIYYKVFIDQKKICGLRCYKYIYLKNVNLHFYFKFKKNKLK